MQNRRDLNRIKQAIRKVLSEGMDSDFGSGVNGRPPGDMTQPVSNGTFNRNRSYYNGDIPPDIMPGQPEFQEFNNQDLPPPPPTQPDPNASIDEWIYFWREWFDWNLRWGRQLGGTPIGRHPTNPNLPSYYQLPWNSPYYGR